MAELAFFGHCSLSLATCQINREEYRCYFQRELYLDVVFRENLFSDFKASNKYIINIRNFVQFIRNTIQLKYPTLQIAI